MASISLRFASFLLSIAILAAEDRLGSVEFYGAAPHAVPDALRASLPLHPGMTLPSDDPSRERLLHQIEQVIKTHTGKPPTDVSPVCCDSNGDWIVYIGIRGPRVLEPSPRPSRTARKTASPVLPQALLNTYRAMLEENVSAVRAGAAEDQSQGYSLSGYEPLRNLQISFRKRILAANSAPIFNVLKRSADSEQRVAAAKALGYLDASVSQIQALVSAASDENSTVRNNALRALWALATVRAPLVLRDAPTAQMARLLRSGAWSDRNKPCYSA